MIYCYIIYVTIALSALTSSEIPPREKLLTMLAETQTSNGYLLTSVSDESGKLCLCVLSQSEKNVQVYTREAKFVSKWEIMEKGIPQRIISAGKNELFIACSSPDVGYYYLIDGKVIGSIKLFRNGSFTFDEYANMHVSTFDRESIGGAGVGYMYASKVAYEYVFLDISKYIPREDKLFLKYPLRPILINNRIYIMDKYYPYIVVINGNREYETSLVLKDRTFIENTMKNIKLGVGNGLFQITSIDSFNDEIIISRVADEGNIEILTVDICGSIKDLYICKKLRMSEKALLSIAVIDDNPMMIAAVDSRTGILRILSEIQ